MSLLSRKQIARLFFFSFFLFSLTSCYTLKVMHGQHQLYSKRKSVARLLKSRRVNEKLKARLRLVDDALKFAEEQGLFVGNSYSQLIFNHQAGAVSFLLQIAYPFQLRWKKWSYPIIGEVPYQGFFDEAARDREAWKWSQKHFDVNKGRATAFSTLGWFSDPLYSSMLKQRDFALVETVFHELIHKTYWIPNDVVANEHLATYLSHGLTRSFLKEKRDVKELESYETYLGDRELFYHWLMELRTSLRAYYKGLSSKDSFEKKDKGKKALIFEQMTSKKPPFVRYDFIGNENNWNNADVLSKGLYQPDTAFFDKVYSCQKVRNVGEFLKVLKKAEGKNFKDKTDFMCRVSA